MIKFPTHVGHREKAWWLDGSLDSVMNAAAETSCSSVGNQSALQTTMILAAKSQEDQPQALQTAIPS